ncbi:phenylalanine--tRNA ligase beta subunit-related protein [uncultured Draconibacterium sp.]|uniref:B3/B4 domain-containing protein n=1 Tax=uncultured Draconibacterium sp. TaxID=1573823 RepID=UPI003217BD74
MQNITIASNLSALIPKLELSCIECDIVLETKNDKLWNVILQKVIELNAELKVEQISQLPGIASSRKAYKLCGKDPARYRLSAEALLRRVLKRKEIYQVNNAVDLLNLVSISSGFSIGGYDAEKINGHVEFGIGRSDEPYEGIGRGELNIEFMPVFRDLTGAFGTPTSDSVRTCVTNDTKRFLMVIINYGASSLSLATQMAIDLLKEYAQATNIELKTISGQ